MDLRIGRISQFLTPSYSSCLRCQTTWPFVKAHTTVIQNRGGFTALCRKCWGDLTPQDRLLFHRQLHDLWEENCPPSPFSWEEMERAVLAEGVITAAGTAAPQTRPA